MRVDLKLGQAAAMRGGGGSLQVTWSVAELGFWHCLEESMYGIDVGVLFLRE